MSSNYHSSFWLKQFDFQRFQTMDKTSPEYLLALSSIRRGVENFVRIVAEREIPVRYIRANTVAGGNESILDSAKAVIEISSPDDIDKIDSIVGRAIAESVHMVVSHQTRTEESLPVFTVVKDIQKNPDHFLTTELRIEMQRLGIDVLAFKDDLVRMLLVIEDRRCDQWMSVRAPGYQPYYDTMYQELWLSDEINMLLALPETQTPTLQNYRFRVTNINNPNNDLFVLSGLIEIKQLIDFPNVSRFAQNPKPWHTYKNNYGFDIESNGICYDDNFLPEMLSIARKSVLLMYQNSKSSESESEQKSSMISAAQQSLDSDLFHQTDKNGLSEEVSDDLEALEASGATMREVGSGMEEEGEPLVKVPCIIYHKLTEKLICSAQFPFVKYNKHFRKPQEIPESVQGLRAGTHMGNALAHRIQVLADESKLVFSRQKKGQIDKRLLAGLGYDNESVFCETLIERKDPIILHLSLDASGSMAGLKWQHAVTLAVALARTAHKIRTLDVIISARSSDNHSNASIAIIFDSRVNSFEHVRQFFPYLIANGSTPEGLAFEAIQDLILDADPHARKFFVNLSDGAPAFSMHKNDTSYYYGGEKAFRHTAHQIRNFRQSGISILSYFVSEGKSEHTNSAKAFRQMYGPAATFIDVAQVASIARTLNKMFLLSGDV